MRKNGKEKLMQLEINCLIKLKLVLLIFLI